MENLLGEKLWTCRKTGYTKNTAAPVMHLIGFYRIIQACTITNTGAQCSLMEVFEMQYSSLCSSDGWLLDKDTFANVTQD
jgi:hypothetical protein